MMQEFGLDRRIVIGLGTLMCVLALIAIIVLSPAEALKSNPSREQQQEQKGSAPTVQDQLQKVQEETIGLVDRVSALEEQSKKTATAETVNQIEAQLGNQGLLAYAAFALAVVSLIVAALSFFSHRATRSKLAALTAAQADTAARVDRTLKEIKENQPLERQTAQHGMQFKQPKTDGGRRPLSDIVADLVSSDDKLPSVSTDRQMAQRFDQPNRKTTIALDQVRRLVENGESSLPNEYRKAAEAIGQLFVLTVENRTLRPAPNEDDGIKRWLIALLNNDGYGILAPSHDYVKDFSISHHKVSAAATAALETFFEIEITSDEALRYVEPCYVRLVGSEFIAEGRGKLSGFSH